ncbi:hypothetical protein D3C73_1303140 [compost metagenome]
MIGENISRGQWQACRTHGLKHFFGIVGVDRVDLFCSLLFLIQIQAYAGQLHIVNTINGECTTGTNGERVHGLVIGNGPKNLLTIDPNVRNILDFFFQLGNDF